MNSSAVKALYLTLVVTSVQGLTPDGAPSWGRSAFGQHPQQSMMRQSMHHGYGSSDMSLQNDYFGMPSYGQPEMGFEGFGGREGYGMPSYGGMMGGGGGYNNGYGNVGMMPPMRRAGFYPDQDTGINSGFGGSDVRPGSSRTVSPSMRNGSAPNSRYERFGSDEMYGRGPNMHHAMGGPGHFRQDMSYGMPFNNRYEEDMMGRDGFRGGPRQGQGQGWRSSNGMGFSQSGRSNTDMDMRYQQRGDRPSTSGYQRPMRPNMN